MIHSLIGSALELSRKRVGYEEGRLRQLLILLEVSAAARESCRSLIPITAEDIEETLRNVRFVESDEAQYFYKTSANCQNALRLEGHPPFSRPDKRSLANAIEESAKLFNEGQCGATKPENTLARANRLTEAMVAHLASVAPRSDSRMNPFYALANGYGVLVQNADAKSQKLEWICKGLAASPGASLFSEVSYVSCDVVCIPRGLSLGVSLFNSLAAKERRGIEHLGGDGREPGPATGFLILMVEGRSTWSLRGEDESVVQSNTAKASPSVVTNKAFDVETMVGDVHYVDAAVALSGRMAHNGHSEHAATLCVFALRSMPKLETTLVHMVRGIVAEKAASQAKSVVFPSKKGEASSGQQKEKASTSTNRSPAANSSDRVAFDSMRDALVKGLTFDDFERHRAVLVSSWASARADHVRAHVKAVHLPLSSLTRVCLSPTVDSILELRDWREGARATFEGESGTVDEPDEKKISGLISMLWPRVLEAFVKVNTRTLESSPTHVMALKKTNEGGFVRFRCSTAFGQTVALLKHRYPSSVSVSEICSSCLGVGFPDQGWDLHRAVAIVAALGVLGIVVRVQA